MSSSEIGQGKDESLGITCAKYERGEGKRCKHYQKSGACSLTEEFMCVEWLKLNASRSTRPPARDLFGNPLPEPKKQANKPAKVLQPEKVVPPFPMTPAGSAIVPPRWGLTEENIQSFKALAVEVCIHSEASGEMWLVPASTGQPRLEFTPENLATIAQVLDAFPRSRVMAFAKSQPAQSETKEGGEQP